MTTIALPPVNNMDHVHVAIDMHNIPPLDAAVAQVANTAVFIPPATTCRTNAAWYAKHVLSFLFGGGCACLYAYRHGWI